MHKIISSSLKTFSEEHCIESMNEAKRFEHFVNYCIASKYYSGRIDTSGITTGDEDPGIDGVIIIVDGELVTTEEEIDAIFESHRRNVEVEFIFIQSKTSEKFEKKELTNFGDCVYDFLSDHPEHSYDEILSEAHKIFDKVVVNFHKVKHGKPNTRTYFVTTGVWNDEKELSAALKVNQKKLESTGYFNNVESLKLDRDEIITLLISIRQPVEAKVKVKGCIPYDNIKGVEEAYICVIPAKNFINSLLKNADDDRIKSGIFEENVRAFLGESNSVNSSIKDTLTSKETRDRFAILNNGITIVSPDVRVQSDTISLSNYQIVNGCQTSHVLFRNKELLTDDSTMLTVKVIEVSDADIINQIVQATNNQSYVEDEKFLSLKSKAKNIEVYFNSCNDDAGDELKIFFERRERQYSGLKISDSKIFDIRTVARAFSAMFLEIPHIAASYPTQIFQQSENKLFLDEQNEIAYYCATLALYKFNKLFNSKKLPSDFSKYKWHTLMLLKYLINNGIKTPELNSKKITQYCQDIIKVLSSTREDVQQPYQVCVEIIKEGIEKGGWEKKDRLKRSLHTARLKKILMKRF
ncbi:AIPR family protein [Microcoleus sp. T3_A4]|uniref:AIPR family protein n=1 Tax=Microcoleus sp. T3_A4 TaxID=2818968 RepID=UPI002FD57154